MEASIMVLETQIATRSWSDFEGDETAKIAEFISDLHKMDYTSDQLVVELRDVAPETIPVLFEAVATEFSGKKIHKTTASYVACSCRKSTCPLPKERGTITYFCAFSIDHDRAQAVLGSHAEACGLREGPIGGPDLSSLLSGLDMDKLTELLESAKDKLLGMLGQSEEESEINNINLGVFDPSSGEITMLVGDEEAPAAVKDALSEMLEKGQTTSTINARPNAKRTLH